MYIYIYCMGFICPVYIGHVVLKCASDLNVYYMHMYICFRSIVPSIRLHINLVICRAVFLLNVMLRLGIVWKKPSKNDLSGHL